jgi:hypothetical protein
MADWKRRHATSVKRRRTRDVKPVRWTDVLRRIAWPIGERAELALWAEVLQWAPITVMATCPLCVVFVMNMHVPIFHDNMGPTGNFAWEALCGDVAKTKTGTQCKYFYLAPVITFTWMFLLALSLHRFATLYHTKLFPCHVTGSGAVPRHP